MKICNPEDVVITVNGVVIEGYAPEISITSEDEKQEPCLFDQFKDHEGTLSLSCPCPKCTFR